MNKLIKQITTLLALIGIFFSAFLMLDTRHASSAKVEQMFTELQYLEKKIERKDLEDRLNSIENRIWRYEEKFGEKLDKASEFTKQEYKRLKKQFDKVLRKLNSLDKGTNNE